MTTKIRTRVIALQRTLLGLVEHTVEVTRMKEGYGVRVFVNGVLNQEAVAENRERIGSVARDLLRMEDKCGNISAFASAARHRAFAKRGGEHE
jgi:hypothetical protein